MSFKAAGRGDSCMQRARISSVSSKEVLGFRVLGVWACKPEATKPHTQHP